MLGQLNRALHAHAVLGKSDRERSLFLIKEWKKIIVRMEARAVDLGYSRACKSHIPVCRGECCRWHFPEKLYDVDFYVSISGMTARDTQNLVRLLTDAGNEAFQCPMLLEKGCFFVFENRPAMCATAYPCFAGNVYWKYMEAEKTRLDEIYKEIKDILQSVRD